MTHPPYLSKSISIRISDTGRYLLGIGLIPKYAVLHTTTIQECDIWEIHLRQVRARQGAELIEMRKQWHMRPPETVNAAALVGCTRADPPWQVSESDAWHARRCNMHRRGCELCPAHGKNYHYCGTAIHFARMCMKRGQTKRQVG